MAGEKPCHDRFRARVDGDSTTYNRRIRTIPGEVTALLLAWRAGDCEALNRIVPHVHAELRRIAQRCMRGEGGHHTLQATALLNEAYLRLIDVRRVDWQNRTHFLAMAARIMRRVLVEAARARRTSRRGAGACRVTLDEGLLVGEALAVELLALNDSLDELAAIDERKCRVVELRYFGGMTIGETAEALSISSETVAREWRVAKAWLRRRIEGD